MDARKGAKEERKPFSTIQFFHPMFLAGFGATGRYPPMGNLTGYVMSTLSEFDINDFRPGDAPDNKTFAQPENGVCYYSDWRYGPDEGPEKK